MAELEIKEFTLEGDLGFGMGLKPGGLPKNFCCQEDTKPNTTTDTHLPKRLTNKTRSETFDSINSTKLERNKQSKSFNRSYSLNEWHRFLRRKSLIDVNCTLEPHRHNNNNNSLQGQGHHASNKVLLRRCRSHSLSGASKEMFLESKRDSTTSTSSVLSEDHKRHVKSRSNSGSNNYELGVIRKLKKRFSNTLFDMKRKGSCNGACKPANSTAIKPLTDLAEAQMTISTLQGKLDIYKELLYGKYKASEVLLNQLLETLNEHQQFENQFEIDARIKQKEMNALQFQLHLSETNLTDAQRVWLERFNQLIKENTDLTATLKSQSDTIRNLTRRNSVLKREKDELTALHDVKEKMTYLQRSNSVEELSNGDSSITAMELAILGACKCRSSKEEACCCAKAASAKQRALMLLQNNLDEFQKEKNEYSRLAQLYQDAFEEQLKRNRALTRRVLMKDCENELFPKNKKLHGVLRLRSNHGNQLEAVNSLVDLVCDRTDAFLHQQLISKALAHRITELENNK